MALNKKQKLNRLRKRHADVLNNPGIKAIANMREKQVEGFTKIRKRSKKELTTIAKDLWKKAYG